jgi:hypothetical protein
VQARARGGAGRWSSGVLMAMVALTVLIGCGGDDKKAATPTTAAAGDHKGSRTSSAGENACPVEGCKVTITKVVGHGDELQITWKANYAPDASRNHIHVYWDTYTADQVSNDAATRGVKQGEWVPTDAYPVFVTEGAVSVAKRGKSTTVCVTAGDGDHNVIDSSIKDCRKVADLL